MSETPWLLSVLVNRYFSLGGDPGSSDGTSKVLSLYYHGAELADSWNLTDLGKVNYYLI